MLLPIPSAILALKSLGRSAAASVLLGLAVLLVTSCDTRLPERSDGPLAERRLLARRRH